MVACLTFEIECLTSSELRVLVTLYVKLEREQPGERVVSATTRSLLKLDQAYYRRLGGRDHSALIGEPDKNGTIRFENLPNELRQVHADALCPVSPKGAVPFVHVNLMCKSGMASNRHSFTSIPIRNLHTMKFRFTAA